jgi:hypothetical protein
MLKKLIQPPAQNEANSSHASCLGRPLPVWNACRLESKTTPAFRNHTGDSSAETTISHQLPGTCHHATSLPCLQFGDTVGPWEGQAAALPHAKALSSTWCDQ